MLDGGVTCETSAACSAPLPYCHPELHACVECLSDRNCGVDGVCHRATGSCATCLSDLDCASPTPYCDTQNRGCVECIVDDNCGPGEEKCLDGKCGSCGDGICGTRELFFSDFGVLGSDFDPGRPTRGCPEDCASLCPLEDLGEKVGKALVRLKAEDLRPAIEDFCTDSIGRNALLPWTAPETGLYAFGTKGSAPGTSLSIYRGSCENIEYTEACVGEEEIFELEFQKGDELLLATNSSSDEGSVVVNIEKVSSCPDGECDPPEEDAGKPNEQRSTAQCLDNAARRRDIVCDGVRCACDHCPMEYDDCAVIPGCEAVSQCMTDAECVGVACYNSGTCRGVIDSHGGVSAPAFRTASRLQSCALTFDCRLPCLPDGGASPDGGQLCEPGRRVVCSCDESGAGSKTCSSDGSAYTACQCGDAGIATDSGGGDGCDCRMSSPRASKTGNFVLAGLALLLLCGRRRLSPNGIQ